MAIAATFDQTGMTVAQYAKVIAALEAAGLGAPDGRIYHICCTVDGGLRVVDHWETPEQLQKFGESLMPILREVGVDPAEPVVHPVHNIIKG